MRPFVLLIGCSEANTEYARPEVTKRFELIQVGDSVEKVYRTIGPPLFIDLNPDQSGNGAYRQESLKHTDLKTVVRFSTETNKELYLTYSQPKKMGKNYVLYAVDIREGKVFRKLGPSYQD